MPAASPDIGETTENYETWMASFGDVNRPELGQKHRLMAEGPFPFLRATFYDWALRYRACCRQASDAPTVLGVGDLADKTTKSMRGGLEPVAKALNALATGLNLTVRNVTTHTRDELSEQMAMERLAAYSYLAPPRPVRDSPGP
jgi:uncharacterized protein Ymh